jgi:hypothetical protein
VNVFRFLHYPPTSKVSVRGNHLFQEWIWW